MTELPDNTRWQLWIVAFGFFMQSLDTTIVNTALPSMAKSLGESPLHMHMVVVSYVLTVAVMLPASGWLADKIGVRNIFFAAIVLFTLGSLFCALSGTLNQLVLARVLQGVGGAMMVPVGRLTVMKIVPRAQYMAAMTFVTLPGQIGPLLGPALGGVLVEYASWHWIFLINIPVGIVGAMATFMLMPNYTIETRRFDLPVKRDTENAKTGQRKYEKTIFRILCVKPPISGGFLSMFKPLPKPFESSLQSIASQELALSCRELCNDVSVTSCATEYLCNQSEIPVAFRTPLA